MISLRDVSVELPAGASDSATIFDGVSLDVGRGDWLAVVGTNGSGKSTLLHAIAGLIAPARGVIDRGPEPGPRVALLLQEPDNQFVATSVSYELAMSVPAGGRTGGADGDAIDRAVERFGLARMLERNPHRLSGGEKQRLALATVWLQDPEVLLLDEPTAYLDGEAAEMCFDFVSEAVRRGVAVVWATPGGAELERAARALCLGSGRVVFEGRPDELYAWADESGYPIVQPSIRRVARLAAAALSDPEGAKVVIEGAGSPQSLARAMVPRVVSVTPPATPPVPAGQREEVRLSSVSFRYDDISAIQGVDLVVHRGECLGLAGPNGAGKSTVLALAAGMYEPASGIIERANGGAKARGQCATFLLFQSPERMFFAETVAEELAFGLERLRIDPAQRQSRARSALERVGLPPEVYLERAPLSLSPGEMRRVAFAIALSLEPGLLLLDEPTSCLDTEGSSTLVSLLGARRAEGGTTVVASHDAAFLAEVCDRVVWLRTGNVIAELVTAGGYLRPGDKWPGEPLAVLELQDALAEAGVEVSPRALTGVELVGRLF